MEENFKPRLRHCTMIKKQDSSSITIVVGDDYYELTTDSDSLESLLRLKSFLDGRRTISEIANIRNLETREVLDIVEQFDNLGLLRTSNDIDTTIPAGNYIKQISSTATMWAKQIGYHKLFSKLNNGTASRQLLIGLLIESYHYVKSASRHISTAISHASDDKSRQILTKYLVEEHAHSELFERGLARAGISRNDLRSSHPTIGTISLVNMLCDIGRESTLAYLSCTSLFEARAATADQAEAEFRNICNSYDLPVETTNAFISHFKIDLAADHTSLLSEYLEDDQIIYTNSAHCAVNYMHDLKHAFDQFHDQIILYYEDISNYIPRPKVDYFCL